MTSLMMEFQRVCAAGVAESRTAAAARELGRRLGLRGAEEHWPQGMQWSFTTPDGITFYTPAGASERFVRRRLAEKLVECAQ